MDSIDRVNLQELSQAMVAREASVDTMEASGGTMEASGDTVGTQWRMQWYSIEAAVVQH